MIGNDGILYRYSPVTKNLMIQLSLNLLWLSRSENFNDPFDVQFRIATDCQPEEERPLLSKLWEMANRNPNLNPEIEAPRETLDSFARYEESLIRNVPICCFWDL